MIVSYFLFKVIISAFSLGAFRPYIINWMTDMVGFQSTILLFVFYYFSGCLGFIVNIFNLSVCLPVILYCFMYINLTIVYLRSFLAFKLFLSYTLFRYMLIIFTMQY